MGKTIKDYIQM